MNLTIVARQFTDCCVNSIFIDGTNDIVLCIGLVSDKSIELILISNQVIHK